MADSETAVLQEQEGLVALEPSDAAPVLEDAGSQATPMTAQEVEDYLRLPADPHARYNVLEEKVSSDPLFANQLKTLLGRQEKASHAAEVAALRAELERAQYNNARVVFDQLPVDRRQAYLAQNPEFAMRIRQAPPDPRQVQEAAYFREQIINTLQDGVSRGLPPEEADRIVEEAKQGRFARDQYGRELHYWDQLQMLQQYVQSGVKHYAGQTKAQPARAAAQVQQAQTEERPRVNPNLGGAGPDTSSRGRGVNATPGKFRASEVNQMSPEQYLQHFPNSGDYTKAVRDGRVVLDT